MNFLIAIHTVCAVTNIYRAFLQDKYMYSQLMEILDEDNADQGVRETALKLYQEVYEPKWYTGLVYLLLGPLGGLYTAHVYRKISVSVE
jgi:hypothetical protein